MYSNLENQWIQVVVTKVEDDIVTIRYLGILEFFTVRALDMQDNENLFRPPSDQNQKLAAGNFSPAPLVNLAGDLR